MKEIVVGFGGYRHSTRALEWASQIALRSGAHVSVLNVYHPAYLEMNPGTHRHEREERKSRVGDTLRHAGHFDFEVIVRDGEAVAELIKFGHERNADLLVVGRHGSMAPGGFGERGAAEELLRSYDRAFVVISDDAPLPEGDGPLTIVVGVDGSQVNTDSVETIAVLAESLSARAIPVLSTKTGVWTRRDHDGARRPSEEAVAALAARLPGNETLRTVNESPVKGLIGAAEQYEANVIAVGTRGHRSFTDPFAGQVARHLIDNSTCAVLVAPHHEV